MQGDWGTQFGMLIQYLEESRPAGLADPSIADLAISDLQVGSFPAQPLFTHMLTSYICSRTSQHPLVTPSAA